MTPAELRTLRKRLGLTQAALATRVGVGARAVRRWEAGDRKISVPIARLIETLTNGARGK